MASETTHVLDESPYTVQTLIDQVPLTTVEGGPEPHITCLELWEQNLYVGTSNGEVLHFVALPEPDGDNAASPSYILASRQEPSPTVSGETGNGVQQIYCLPSSARACILCNGMLTFHSLPELSPWGSRKVPGCVWVGGSDLDGKEEDATDEGEDVVMICTKKRIRLLRIGEDIQVLRNIEFPSCQVLARRGRIACVADANSYAMIDVENQQKIPLFPISTVQTDNAELGAEPARSARTYSEELPTRPDDPSSPFGSPSPGDRGHNRVASLGQMVGGLRAKTIGQPSTRTSSLERIDRGSPSPSRSRRIDHSESPSKPLPDLPPEERLAPKPTSSTPLRPMILSPSSNEFLVTIGAARTEPGVGMFVNSEGDVVRGTLSFAEYPQTCIVDTQISSSVAGLAQSATDDFILSLVQRHDAVQVEIGIEAQRWEPAGAEKSWLPISLQKHQEIQPSTSIPSAGMSTVVTAVMVNMADAGNALQARPWRRPRREARGEAHAALPSPNAQQQSARMQQEQEFSSRLGNVRSRTLLWCGTQVSTLIRSPILVRLENRVQRAYEVDDNSLDQDALTRIMQDMRLHEPQSELEFLSIEYIRQKISLLLFANALKQGDFSRPSLSQDLLLEGGLDPRVILSLIASFKADIVQNPEGFWIHQGLIDVLEKRYGSLSVNLETLSEDNATNPVEALNFVKSYLHSWRQRKGFGSIADEAAVFASVDGALLHLLLHEARQQKGGPSSSPALRAELYAIVDAGVDNFDHAVDLMERYHRLYALSRLYQSRRRSADVLKTWRRILEGENDEGADFTDGENEMRKYLAKRGDVKLFEEYGCWLARRNPQVGVQLFADDQSKVRYTPAKTIALLQDHAPVAVKDYLEHLVFVKKESQFADQLISYYLDHVLETLRNDPEACDILAQTYETYRALANPRPTYRQFIMDNSISARWWSDRLRLLELLGGSYGSDFHYEISSVLKRLEPFEDALVPESIILEGRQGHHQQALRLLTRGLGDYHTAINYCLLGGSSIFHPAVAGSDRAAAPSQAEQTRLFGYLLNEVLSIEDDDSRLERTSELLGRFGAWFDAMEVLGAIPDHWPVETISGFLHGALRRLVQQKHETGITKALSGVENLKVSMTFVDKTEELGPHVVPAMDTPTSMT